MQSFEITNRKHFMAKLLKSDLFNSFEVREAVIHTVFKLVVDGKRNMDYFNDITEDYTTPLSNYLTWGDIQKYIYTLMNGNKLPTYFKIVLSTNQTKTEELSPLASTFYFNITFKENIITITTGTAYKVFTLDQTPDTLWDKQIQEFLFKYQFI